MPSRAEGTGTAPLNNRLSGKILMAKEEMVQFEGVIDEVLPNAFFRVRLENGCVITAYASGKIRKYRIRILIGDRVTIEMSPYDLSRGRIPFRNKEERPFRPRPVTVRRH